MSVDYTPVDPRVQIELEKLNTATNHINKYEQILDEAKLEFKKLLEESVVRIKQSAHKLGNSIQSAKPYYEARLYATNLSKDTQQAIVNYEKAKSVHAAAKEMVFLAEQGLGEKSTLDTACQEMLSHAASRVNESQLECSDTRNILKISELKQEVANNRVVKLQAQLKSAIKASSYNIRRKLLFMNLLAYQHDLLCLPYYETRANYNGLLKNQKEKITNLETKVSEAKMSYNEALKNLERISEEIHKMRQEQRLLNNYNNINSPEQQSNNINNCTSFYLENQHQQRHSNNESDGIFTTTNNFMKSTATTTNCNNKYSSKINTCDEYLDLPPKLSIKSSPIRQRNLDKHDCPHLLNDFENSRYFTGDIYENCNDNDIFKNKKNDPTSSSSILSNLTDDIEQWTEIRLSNSESTSSGYSPHHHDSILINDCGGNNDDDDENNTSSSDDNKKITCTTVFNGGGGEIDKKLNESYSGGGISSWITRSNSIKSTGGRRQSLDLLLDASDRVKDVFTSSFQKVGKSLERRNSESEVNNENTNTDFFSFSRSDKDGLTDEQVQNLLLNEENCDDDNINFIVKGVNDISK